MGASQIEHCYYMLSRKNIVINKIKQAARPRAAQRPQIGHCLRIFYIDIRPSRLMHNASPTKPRGSCFLRLRVCVDVRILCVCAYNVVMLT